MSAAGARVGRFYTAARRHPWVLGRVADWKIPLGPYTPAQVAVAVVGGFLLLKSISWWSWMGPVPVIAWVLAIWAVRQPKVQGRAPMRAAAGWVLLGWQPRGGRIGGRAARDRASRPLLGSFSIEDASASAPAVRAAPSPRARQHAPREPLPQPATGPSTALRHGEPAATAAPKGPVSGVHQLLALAQTGGAR